MLSSYIACLNQLTLLTVLLELSLASPDPLQQEAKKARSVATELLPSVPVQECMGLGAWHIYHELLFGYQKNGREGLDTINRIDTFVPCWGNILRRLQVCVHDPSPCLALWCCGQMGIDGKGVSVEGNIQVSTTLAQVM